MLRMHEMTTSDLTQRSGYNIVTALDCRGRDGTSGRRESSLYEANRGVPLGRIFNRVTVKFRK